jgi:hypothetical protein
MTKTLSHRLFGVGRVPPIWRERLVPEGILREEEGVRLVTTMRYFKTPWRVAFTKKTQRCTGALVVTGQRVVGFARARSTIHVPWTHPNAGKLKFEVEPDILLIEYSAQHFIEEMTGTVELRFHLEDPAAFLAAIETATGMG